MSQYLLPRTHEDGKDILGYFLEPKGPATIEPKQNQRIPAGMYRMMNHVGVRHQNVPKLFNDYVSPDRHILIHKGQTHEDTLGCLIPGVADRGDSIWLNGEDQELYGSDPSETKFEKMKKYISDNGGYNDVKLHLFDFIKTNPPKIQEEEALWLGIESGYFIPFS